MTKLLAESPPIKLAPGDVYSILDSRVDRCAQGRTDNRVRDSFSLESVGSSSWHHLC